MKGTKKVSLLLISGTLIMSLFTVNAVGAQFPEGNVKDILITSSRIDIVHTTALSIPGEVITIDEVERTYSLLALQEGVLAALGALGIDITALPEGIVTQFRFHVTAAMIVLDGTLRNLIIPGGVIRLKVILEVPGIIDAVFTFDADKSVKRTSQGQFMLKPPITFETVSSLNAQFIKWQEESYTIHIFHHADAGRPGQPAAVVNAGQVVLFGFEWVGESLEELHNEIIGNSAHDITLSVDGGIAFSVKTWYQEPFVAEPGIGPQRNWDHDNDGLGDGDGDGISDLVGPILFFRYRYPFSLTAGSYTFTFSLTFDGGNSWFPLNPPETINVVAI